MFTYTLRTLNQILLGSLFKTEIKIKNFKVCWAVKFRCYPVDMGNVQYGNKSVDSILFFVI